MKDILEVKEVGKFYTIRDLLSDVQVMLGQTGCAAYIHMHKGIGNLRERGEHYPYGDILGGGRKRLVDLLKWTACF
eukprot:370740-Pelagomonas_calceolata.AAC.1